MKTVMLLMVMALLVGCSQKKEASALKIASLEADVSNLTARVDLLYGFIDELMQQEVKQAHEESRHAGEELKTAEFNLMAGRLKTLRENGIISTNAYENAMTDLTLGRNPWPATNETPVYHWGDPASNFLKDSKH